MYLTDAGWARSPLDIKQTERFKDLSDFNKTVAKGDITENQAALHFVCRWKETAEKMSNPAPEMR